MCKMFNMLAARQFLLLANTHRSQLVSVRMSQCHRLKIPLQIMRHIHNVNLIHMHFDIGVKRTVCHISSLKYILYIWRSHRQQRVFWQKWHWQCFVHPNIATNTTAVTICLHRDLSLLFLSMSSNWQCKCKANDLCCQSRLASNAWETAMFVYCYALWAFIFFESGV